MMSRIEVVVPWWWSRLDTWPVNVGVVIAVVIGGGVHWHRSKYINNQKYSKKDERKIYTGGSRRIACIEPLLQLLLPYQLSFVIVVG